MIPYSPDPTIAMMLASAYNAELREEAAARRLVRIAKQQRRGERRRVGTVDGSTTRRWFSWSRGRSGAASRALSPHSS